MPFGAVMMTMGAGMSIAGAAGAFGGGVDGMGPTPEELKAAEDSRWLFDFGQNQQRPLDRQTRKDLKYMKTPEYANRQAAVARNGVMDAGSMAQDKALTRAAAQSGGPDSGRFAATLGATGAALQAGSAGADAQGRLGAISARQQLQDAYLGRLSNDARTGLSLVQNGAQQAQAAKMDRINAQIQNNAAKNKAIGSLGGAMMSMGQSMGGFSGLSGAFGGGDATLANGNGGEPYVPLTEQNGAGYLGQPYANAGEGFGGSLNYGQSFGSGASSGFAGSLNYGG